MNTNSFLLKVKSGPGSWGLPTRDNVDEYTVIVNAKDYPYIWNDSEYHINDDQKLYKLNILQSQYFVDTVASIRMVTSHTSDIDGTCDALVDFWKHQQSGMIEISPLVTYSTTLDQINRWILSDATHHISTAIWYIGIIYRWYMHHSVTYDNTNVFDATDEWYDRYISTINSDNITLNDIKAWLPIIDNDEVLAFFRSLTENKDLMINYSKLIRVIDKELNP